MAEHGAGQELEVVRRHEVAVLQGG
jgi:hypothetical protein